MINADHLSNSSLPTVRRCGANGIRWLVCLVILTPATLYGAQFQQFGEVTVFYSAVASTLIPEQVAALHGIVRAENRALVNVTIKKNDLPAKARVTGYSTNLLNQTNQLAFVEAQEQAAIYYLTSVPVGKNEILRFTVNIEIENHSEPISLNFEQAFY
jgi:hypothetical protein